MYVSGKYGGGNPIINYAIDTSLAIQPINLHGQNQLTDGPALSPNFEKRNLFLATDMYRGWKGRQNQRLVQQRQANPWLMREVNEDQTRAEADEGCLMHYSRSVGGTIVLEDSDRKS